MLRILVICGLPESLLNFRGPLLQALVSRGHSVSACANGHDSFIKEKLGALGVAYHPIHLLRAGTNPLIDLCTLLDLIKLMRRVKPDIVFSYTIKPVIYGSLVAQLCGVSAIYSMITGLGYAFMESKSLGQRLFKFIIIGLYRATLKRNRRVFFQNINDRKLFLDLKIVQQNQACLINGSGVDLDHFAMTSLPPKDKMCFLLIARLLRDKGVVEYAEAARMVKLTHPQTRFLLVGGVDPNPACVTQGELQRWIEKGFIEYLGYLEDVRPAIAASSVYVLPSYREGTPRSVLEAMAMGRPIITTDAPGCRETIKRKEVTNSNPDPKGIIEGKNGFLVPIKNAEKLAEAMKRFILYPSLVDKMGQCSRQYAVDRYDVHKVNAVILEAMGLA